MSAQHVHGYPRDGWSRAAIQGLMVAVMNFGGITGAALAGWLHDNTGGYELAWISYAIVGGLSIPMILMARRPVKRKVV